MLLSIQLARTDFHDVEFLQADQEGSMRSGWEAESGGARRRPQQRATQATGLVSPINTLPASVLLSFAHVAHTPDRRHRRRGTFGTVPRQRKQNVGNLYARKRPLQTRTTTRTHIHLNKQKHPQDSETKEPFISTGKQKGGARDANLRQSSYQVLVELRSPLLWRK
jgi:hypothetical protein